MGLEQNIQQIQLLQSLLTVYYSTSMIKRITSPVIVDLSKAFDTLDHKIEIDKLQHYGIRGISLMWFESCLSKEQSQST